MLKVVVITILVVVIFIFFAKRYPITSFAISGIINGNTQILSAPRKEIALPCDVYTFTNHNVPNV